MLLPLTFGHKLTTADGIKNITNVYVAMNYTLLYVFDLFTDVSVAPNKSLAL
jgi:hypothetical protein